MSKEAMLDTRESAMNHAMVITGVNLENDTPTKWKIENSWGDRKSTRLNSSHPSRSRMPSSA